MLYVAENGRKWRRLPKEHGDWHVIYVRVNCWEKGHTARGIICTLAATGNHPNPCKCIESGFHLHQSTSRRYGRFEKGSPQSVGRTRCGWNTKLHIVAASKSGWGDVCAVCGKLRRCSGGCFLLRQLSLVDRLVYLLMDLAYEGDETRALAAELWLYTCSFPKGNRKNPWDYDKHLYKQRHQVKRLIRRLKRFPRFYPL